MATLADIQQITTNLFVPPTATKVEDESSFAGLVRSASVLLKQNNPVSYSDIKLITPSVYHRIFLRIAAGRNSINGFLYTDDDVLSMMDPAGSTPGTEARFNLYGGDLQWCAAKLVAAHLLRTIPLQSNLKFKDVADNLETQALEDIDRIILLLSTSSDTVASETSLAGQSQVSLYIAHSLNLSTIPESSFDIPDVGSSPATYEQPVEVKNVETYSNIVIPTGKMGYCHIYMTGQVPYADQDLISTRAIGGPTGSPQNSNSVSYAIRINVPLENQWTIDDLIIELADSINSVCLSAGSANSTLSNILCTPKRGRHNTQTLSSIKKQLYPSTDTLRNRAALYDLTYRVNSLNFTTRRYSNKVHTELFTVTFYTIDDPLAHNTDDISTYNDTNLSIGTFDSLSKIKQNNPSFSLGIEGLIFGEQENFNTLDTVTPRGFFLTVQKGDKASVSIESTSGSSSSESADNLADADSLNVLDTFYFYTSDVVIGDLQLRISSTKYNAELPTDIIVPTDGVSDGETIAERVVDAIYKYTQDSNKDEDITSNSNILGVLLGDYEQVYTSINQSNNTVTELPLEKSMDINGVMTTVQPLSAQQKDQSCGRVQVVGFKYTVEEYRIVVDILNVPTNLEVAIGNYILRKTSWSNRRRSIQVEAKTLSSTSATVTQTTAEELASVNAKVGKAEASKSEILQRVYDKRRLLIDAQRGFPTKWNKQT